MDVSADDPSSGLECVKTAIIFRDADLATLRDWSTRSGRLNRYLSLTELPFSASLAGVQLDGLSVYCAAVRGGLVNTAGAAGAEVVIGCVVRGVVAVNVNAEWRVLTAGDGLLFLPGDVVVQALKDCEVLTLRLPVSVETLSRI